MKHMHDKDISAANPYQLPIRRTMAASLLAAGTVP
jgi:hypothetical protein